MLWRKWVPFFHVVSNVFLNYLQFYSSKNTIMFDDLRRNFVLNPQNGLTIRPFRKAHANRDSDQELVKLTQYLLAIADLDDLSSLDHSNWENFIKDNTKRRRQAWELLSSFKISKYYYDYLFEVCLCSISVILWISAELCFPSISV